MKKSSLQERDRTAHGFPSSKVNKNYQSAMHCDKLNLGPSYIVGVGNYTDGGLWVHGRGEVACHNTVRNTACHSTVSIRVLSDDWYQSP
jgi:hypothetical protein